MWFMSFPVNLQTTELLIYFESSWFMVHDSKVRLIRRCTFRIIENVNNETHGCIWHAAPMSKLKAELEHHIGHCQMFSHHSMFIGAFITWVRHHSILFTFILRRCNTFIISVIVVIRRSIIFTEHFLWHLITMGNFHLCSHGFQHVMLSKWVYNPYMSHDWLAWVLFITAWHGPESIFCAPEKHQKTEVHFYLEDGWKMGIRHSLTHWGRVAHICVGDLTIIGSDNGLSPGRRQAII